ncbi:MAG: hypothetical protein Q8P08_02020 [bacterium]|nr:hypothetical protein [bacterium]
MKEKNIGKKKKHEESPQFLRKLVINNGCPKGKASRCASELLALSNSSQEQFDKIYKKYGMKFSGWDGRCKHIGLRRG